MTGGFISLRYFNADTTCITIDLASLSGIVLCCNEMFKTRFENNKNMLQLSLKWETRMK